MNGLLDSALAEWLGGAATDRQPATIGIAVTGPDRAEQVAAFRAAADLLSGRFGRASMVGSYGDVRPFFLLGDAAGWGDPFMRWCGPANMLELRTSPTGIELGLHPIGPFEEWYWRAGNAGTLDSGFLAIDSDTGGWSSFPGGSYAVDLDDLRRRWSRMLRTWPAECRALGVAPWLYITDKSAGDDESVSLEVWPNQWPDSDYLFGCFVGALDLGRLGWRCDAEPPAGAPWLPLPEGSGPPDGWLTGTSDLADAAAELLVDTLVAAGVTSPYQPRLLGESADCLISGAGCESYLASFYWLGIPVEGADPGDWSD